MNLEDEIYSLSAFELAMQTMFGELCHGLIAYDPRMADILTRVFDHSSNHVESMTIQLGKSANPKHTVKALRVVEETRTVVLGDKIKPKDGI
jgi:hypothetical protein